MSDNKTDIDFSGKEWITSTQGTDITEVFESYHVTEKPHAMLTKYYVKDISTPRNSPYTFHENGFFKTFKGKVSYGYWPQIF